MRWKGEAGAATRRNRKVPLRAMMGPGLREPDTRMFQPRVIKTRGLSKSRGQALYILPGVLWPSAT